MELGSNSTAERPTAVCSNHVLSDDPLAPHNDGFAESNEENGEDWDYLDDGYYSLEERAAMRSVVFQERLEMSHEAESSKLGTYPSAP